MPIAHLLASSAVLAFGKKKAEAPEPPPPADPLMMILSILICWGIPALIMLLGIGNEDRSEARAAALQRLKSKSTKRKPIVGGNWKCNPEDPSKLGDLVKNISKFRTMPKKNLHARASLFM